MPESMQGIIIALLIVLFIGIIIGFYLRQSRVTELTKALEDSQARHQMLQQEHEERLRAATVQLQQDYEVQLAEKIEQYQSQYEEQLQQLESEYQARQSLLVPGGPAGSADPSHPPGLPYTDLDAGPMSDTEQRIRKQYETRLKEAAYKIQQAYEQHLRDKLAEAHETYQREYDQRLAQAIEHYQDEMTARLAEASEQQALQAAALGLEPVPEGAMTVAPVPAEPEDASQAEQLAILEAKLRAEYDQRLAERIEQYQDEMTRRNAQLEDELAARLQMAQANQPVIESPDTQAIAQLEARLRSEIEQSLKAEYEERLAAKIEQYQDQLSQRTRELEEGLEARLQFFQQSGETGSPEGSPPTVEPLDLDALLNLETGPASEMSATEPDTDLSLESLDELLSTANPEETDTDSPLEG